MARGMLRDRVARIWVLIYDNEPARTYVYLTKEKVLAAIDGSVRSYALDESKHAEETYRGFVDKFREHWDAPFIPGAFQLSETEALLISVVRLELDSTNPLHVLLSDCFAAISDSDIAGREALLGRIAGIFGPRSSES